MKEQTFSELYHAAAWPETAAQVGGCERFVLPYGLLEAAGYQLVWRDVLPGERHSYRSIYYHEDGDERRLMVDVMRASSFTQAKEILVGMLANTAHFAARSTLESLGDVAFGVHTTQNFVRNNVVMSVASVGSEDVDVRPWALELDQALLRDLTV